jgi:hypothetical protein
MEECPPVLLNMQQIKIMAFYAKPVTLLPRQGTGKVRNMLEFVVLKLLL